MEHPPKLLCSSPLLLREGGRHQWPGEARSTVSAGMTSSTATGHLGRAPYFLGAGAAGAALPPRKMRKKSEEDGSSTITSLFLLKLAR